MSEEVPECAIQDENSRRLVEVPEGKERRNESARNKNSEVYEDLSDHDETGILGENCARKAPPGPTISSERRAVPATTTTTQVTFANNSDPAQVLLPVSVLALLFGALCAVFLKMYLEPPSAYDELRSYTLSQSEGMKVESIAELPVDDLNSFAQSTCVEARRADDIRAALRANLRIPTEVRDMLISSAVVDGVSTSSTISNTTSDLASEGKAISFVAFWSTVYTEPSLGREWYSSCVMAAGITIVVSEQVAEWVTRHDRVVTGSQPCHCGRFWCERCPVFQTRETRTPVFKRHTLTLKNQLHLHTFMKRSALDSARGILDAKSSRSLFGAKRVEEPALSWEAPDEHIFRGADRPSLSDDSGKVDRDFDTLESNQD